MWLLLVAVGSGYLARCYQHVLRAGSFRLAEIGQTRLLQTRDGFEFQSLEAAAAETTQLALVEPLESSAHRPPPAQLDPVSKPPISSQEEPHILETHPNLEVYTPRDQSQDAISGAAQIAGEQDSQYARDMGEDETASLAGACSSYPDENLLHTIRPKRQKLFHRTPDMAPCMDSNTVHTGSAEDVVHGREEALLRCGLALGVLLASKSQTNEIQRLQQLLTDREAQLKVIEQGSKRSIGNPVPEPEPILQAGEKVEEPNQNSVVEFFAGIENGDMMEETQSEEECVQILSREGASSSLHVEQMTELEVELEAELKQLTGQFSDDVVDKDGVAAHVVVVQGDLNIKGLSTARIESDEDDDSAPEVPCMNNYAVSPRELTRLLHKLQATLQEERISKLEEDLELVETQLQLKEEELEKWKKRTVLLREHSLTSTPDTLLDLQGTILDESVHGYTITGGQEKFQVPVQQPSGSSGFNLLDSFLDAWNNQRQEGSTGSSSKASSRLFKSKLKPDSMMAGHSEESTFFETHDQDGYPQVDRKLDIGNALESLRANDDEVCDEFLQAMLDGGGAADPAWINEQDTQVSSECKQSVFDDLKADSNLFVGVAEYLKLKTSNLGSISPSISDFSDALSMFEDWASGSDSVTTLGQNSHSRAALQDASKIPDWITTALYGSPGEMKMSVSKVSDGKPRETTDMTTLSSTKYTDPSIIKSVPGSSHQNPTTSCWNTDDELDHAGVNTPCHHHSSKQSMLSTCSKAEELLECRSGESSPRVADQNSYGDDLITRRPAKSMRGDWKRQLECQSQASNYYYKQQQQQQEGYQDSSNVKSNHCCKESLVVTTDHEQTSSSGNLPFTTIAAERRKHGSDIFPSEKHAMLSAARPTDNTTDIEEEEALRVQISVQSRKRVKEVPNKLGTKDGIETEEEEYKFLQRQLQQLRM